MKKADIKPGSVYAKVRGNEIMARGTGYGEPVKVLDLDWDDGHRANSWSTYQPKPGAGKKVLLLRQSGHRVDPHQEIEWPEYTLEQAKELYASRSDNSFQWRPDPNLRAQVPKEFHLGFAALTQIKLPWDEYLTQLDAHIAATNEAKARVEQRAKVNNDEGVLIAKELESFSIPARVNAMLRTVTLSFEQYHQIVDRTGAN